MTSSVLWQSLYRLSLCRLHETCWDSMRQSVIRYFVCHCEWASCTVHKLTSCIWDVLKPTLRLDCQISCLWWNSLPVFLCRYILNFIFTFNSWSLSFSFLFVQSTTACVWVVFLSAILYTFVYHNMCIVYRWTEMDICTRIFLLTLFGLYVLSKFFQFFPKNIFV
jgi:hypothetical protein